MFAYLYWLPLVNKSFLAQTLAVVERWLVPLYGPELCTNAGKAHYIRLVCLQNEIFSFHLKFRDRETRQVLLSTAHVSHVESQRPSDRESVRTTTCQILLSPVSGRVQDTKHFIKKKSKLLLGDSS